MSSQTTDIEKWFTFHPGNPETIPKHELVRNVLRVTAHHLSGTVPDGPEKTLGLRKLQEAMFYFNAAIAYGGKE